MQAQRLTCIIVDDEIDSTEVLAQYVSQIPYLNLKKIFQNSTEALAYLLKTPTDLLITDIEMPHLTGIQLYECIVTQVQTKVIFVSGYAEKIAEALQYNVVDYLYKPFSEKRFEEATQKALNNLPVVQVIPKEILEEVLKKYYTLSIAEKRVLDLIADLKTTKQIANELFISLKTAEGHRFNIRKKLGLLPKNDLTEVAIFLKERIN